MNTGIAALACCLMALNSLGLNQWTFDSLYAFCATKSIWTIDIAHVLYRCGVKQCIYSTTCIGANPHYGKELQFYAEEIEVDRVRVNKLFQKAEAAGIHVHEGSLSLEQLIGILKSRKYLIIALVDKHLLLTSQTVGSIPSQPAVDHQGYAGHYVVVEGFDYVRREFIIKDPSPRTGDVWINADVFNAARKAYGTDEDMLFIPFH